MKSLQSIVPALLAIALVGCGGSKNSSSTPVRGRGTASLRVIWPSREGRAIPVAANSIRIALTQNGSPVTEQLVARPTNGNETQTDFTDLPVGVLDVAVTAYPNADGTGVGQAVGSSTLTTSIDAPATATVSLVSTALTLSIEPTTIRVGKGTSTTLTATAKDANGGDEAIQWSVNDPSIATVTGHTATATLKGLAAGTVLVKAKMVIDDEGHVVTGSNTGTVVSASGTVIVK